MNQQYEDFKYVIADLSRIYFGTRYSYRELIASEDVSFKLRMIFRTWMLSEVEEDTTLESHLYYLDKDSTSYEVLHQLGAKARVSYPVYRGFPGRQQKVYAEKILFLYNKKSFCCTKVKLICCIRKRVSRYAFC